MFDPVSSVVCLEDSLHNGMFGRRMLRIGHRLIRAQQFHFLGHPQDAEQFGKVVAGERGLHFLDSSHGNRLYFGLFNSGLQLDRGMTKSTDNASATLSSMILKLPLACVFSKDIRNW